MLRAAPALLLERATPYPAWLERRIAHPVVWIGAGLDRLERRWNRPQGSSPHVRRGLGTLSVALTAGAAALPPAPWWSAPSAGQVQAKPSPPPSPCPASPSAAWTTMCEPCCGPLQAGDLLRARSAVARIVGRDTAGLDEHGVASAALESLAESFNDGVVAPAFWLMRWRASLDSTPTRP